MIKGLKTLSWVAVCGVLTACASGSHVLTGSKYPATNSSQVAVYSSAPRQPYEVIGEVNASSSLGFTQQGRLDSALETLREEAAKLGANGIIVPNAANGSGGVSTRISTGISGGTHGVRTGLGTGITIHPANVRGTAILVIDQE